MATDPLVDYTLRLGDTCLILGHRVSQWCGHAPVLEEDIALANVALDLIGQARLWLGLAAKLEGAGRSADDLAYLRDAPEFRNFLLVERPNVDFGHTMMRQFLFDAWHVHTLAALEASTEPRLAEIAGKARKEAAYHLTRSTELVIGLGDGTGESHARMQSALDALWSYTGEMFLGDAVDATLAASGVAPPADLVRPLWEAHVAGTLAAATLRRPAGTYAHTGGRRGVHTEHLGYVLAEMQFLQRAYPGATW